MTFLDDPYDIAPLLSEDGWTINARGDAWVVPAVQCYGLRITEIGTLLFDALQLEMPVNVARDFHLSGIIVDDRLIPGLLDTPSSLRPPGAQPPNTWIEIQRWNSKRPLILEITNRCQHSRRFRATLLIRARSSGEISHVSLG